MVDAGFSYSTFAGGGIPAVGFGGGFGLPGAKVLKEDPTRQYVAGGNNWISPTMPIVLPDMVDEVMRDRGPAIYEAMADADPVVASHTAGLAMGIIAAKVELMPAVRPIPKPAKVAPLLVGQPPAPATKAAPGAAAAPKAKLSHRFRVWMGSPPATQPAALPPGSEGDAGDDPGEDIVELTPEERRSQEIRDFCQRQLNRCRTDFKSWALQMIHGALLGGHKLAERVCCYPDYGQDSDKICLQDIKPRPRWSYRFVVNNFMDLIGVLSWNPADMEWVILPEEHFIRATWLPRDGDPRGRSQLRAAFTWWQLKRLLPACYYRFLKQHGSPIRFGFTGPDQQGDVPQIDIRTGAELTNLPRVSAPQRLKQTLEWLEEGSVGAFSYGTVVRTDWPQGKGDPFLAAFDLCDRQMALALFHSTRVTMEAKYGSKADSTTAQDEKGLLIHYGRSILRTLVTQALRPLVEANFGMEDAETHMPEVIVEKDEHQDRAALWTAAAAIFPWLKPSQLAPFCAILGIPPAAEGEDPMVFRSAGSSPSSEKTVPIDNQGQLTPDARVGRDAA